MSSGPSLEPYLRARDVNPSLIPTNTPRGLRRSPQVKVEESDFVDFLQRLIHLLISPVMIPLRFISRTLRSPLTISLVLRLILLGFLVLSSAIFSVLAVGAFWWSWGTGGTVEVEGWLTYGSRDRPIPHALVPLPAERIEEDLRYDVQVEMELVRPPRGQEETGNFMLSLELRSSRNPGTVVIGASQPSLPPPALPSSFLSIPSFPTQLLPPCILPWPVRSLCPSRVFGYDSQSLSTVRRRRTRGRSQSPVNGKEVVLLKKDLMEAVLLRPSRGGEAVVGAAFVSIGREDAVGDGADSQKCSNLPKEVRTTGWVVIRFIPRPTGIRWILSAHPLPPLLLLPPVSLTLTLSSSLLAFLIITYLMRSRPSNTTRIAGTDTTPNPMSEEALLAEKRKRTFAERDRTERQEERRRQEEWELVESSAIGGGLRKMPADKKRSMIGDSTVGGSATTAPTVRSFAPVPESYTDDSTASASETDVTDDRSTGTATADRTDGQSDDWDN